METLIRSKNIEETLARVVTFISIPTPQKVVSAEIYIESEGLKE